MLDYLDNLMEDASDFSKSFHAIALTNMEVDQLKWTDTDRLDRILRAHAQRHLNSGQVTNSRASLPKQQKR